MIGRQYSLAADDILHVVSARLLGCDHFLSFDQRARKLAALEDFAVSGE